MIVLHHNDGNYDSKMIPTSWTFSTLGVCVCGVNHRSGGHYKSVVMVTAFLFVHEPSPTHPMFSDRNTV